MSISRVITNETHLGIGTLPVSQRATVTRWTPRASASPDCVIPCDAVKLRVGGAALLTVLGLGLLVWAACYLGDGGMKV